MIEYFRFTYVVACVGEPSQSQAQPWMTHVGPQDYDVDQQTMMSGGFHEDVSISRETPLDREEYGSDNNVDGPTRSPEGLGWLGMGEPVLAQSANLERVNAMQGEMSDETPWDTVIHKHGWVTDLYVVHLNVYWKLACMHACHAIEMLTLVLADTLSDALCISRAVFQPASYSHPDYSFSSPSWLCHCVQAS
jgi:hypothetical protein